MTESADFAEPMELVGVPIPGGDSRVMAECLIEEYLFLGWDEQRIMLLFTRPCFRSTHRIYQELGEVRVRSLIEEVRARWVSGSNHGEPLDA